MDKKLRNSNRKLCRCLFGVCFIGLTFLLDSLLVTEVDAGSPADNAGVQPGVRIVGLERTVHHKPQRILISTKEELVQAIGLHTKFKLLLEVVHRQKQHTVKRPSAKHSLGLTLEMDTLRITEIQDIAEGCDFTIGHHVTKVNGKPVSDIKEFKNQLGDGTDIRIETTEMVMPLPRPITKDVLISSLANPIDGVHIVDVIGPLVGLGTAQRVSIADTNREHIAQRVSTMHLSAYASAVKQLQSNARKVGASAVLDVDVQITDGGTVCRLVGTGVTMSVPPVHHVDSPTEKFGKKANPIIYSMLPANSMENVEVEHDFGVIAGVCCRTPGMYSLRNARIMVDMSSLETEAWQEALEHLGNQARAMGANAVVGIKYVTNDTIKCPDSSEQSVDGYQYYVTTLIGSAVKLVGGNVERPLAVADNKVPFKGLSFSTLSQPPSHARITNILGVAAGVSMCDTWPKQQFTKRLKDPADKFKPFTDSAISLAIKDLATKAQAAGAHAVLGITIEMPTFWSCILRGTLVTLELKEDASDIVNEQTTTKITTSTLPYPPVGQQIVKHAGLVFAVVPKVPKWMLGPNKSVDEVVYQQEDAWREAVYQLTSQAKEMKANAVYGVKFLHSPLSFMTVCVGTAVNLSNKQQDTSKSNSLDGFRVLTTEYPPDGSVISEVLGIVHGPGVVIPKIGGNTVGLFAAAESMAESVVKTTSDAHAGIEQRAKELGANAILSYHPNINNPYMANVFGTAVKLSHQPGAVYRQGHEFDIVAPKKQPSKNVVIERRNSKDSKLGVASSPHSGLNSSQIADLKRQASGGI